MYTTVPVFDSRKHNLNAKHNQTKTLYTSFQNDKLSATARGSLFQLGNSLYICCESLLVFFAGQALLEATGEVRRGHRSCRSQAICNFLCTGRSARGL